MIDVTFYKRPNGRQELVQIKNISDSAASYINQNNIIVSMEQTPIGFAAYFDDGKQLEDGTPDELILIAKKEESCTSMLDRAECLLRKRAK